MNALKSWLMWLGILLAATAAIGISFAISWFNTDLANVVEYTMYGVILGLATSLIIRQYGVMRMLQNEADRASAVVQQLAPAIARDRDSAPENGATEHTREAIQKLAHAIPNLSESTPRGARRYYFERHIAAVESMSQSGHEPTQNVLIEILHERLSADNKSVELFASVLITLGLIGTILGLMLMMSSLTDVMIASGGGDGLLQALASDAGPLAGLGVAFMTTLMGSVLGGVVLRVLTGIVERSISEFVALVAELTEVHIIGRLK
jgi:hypothetical protein